MLLVSGGAGAADRSDPLPPTVAELHRAMQSTDHVIVYHLAPPLEIDRVENYERSRERDPSGVRPVADFAPETAEERTRLVSPIDVSRPTAGRQGASAGSPIASGSPLTAWGQPPSVSDLPQLTSTSVDTVHIAHDGSIPDFVIRHIFDRVSVLIVTTRNAVLGTNHGPEK